MNRGRELALVGTVVGGFAVLASPAQATSIVVDRSNQAKRKLRKKLKGLDC